MTDPQNVKVTNEEPLIVSEANTKPRDVNIVSDSTSRSTTPEATLAQINADIVKASAQQAARILFASGSAKVNLIWESTQAILAGSVVLTTCVGILIGQFLRVANSSTVSIEFPPEWWTVVGLVIGFYFGRTNHTRSAAGDGAER